MISSFDAVHVLRALTNEFDSVCPAHCLPASSSYHVLLFVLGLVVITHTAAVYINTCDHH